MPYKIFFAALTLVLLIVLHPDPASAQTDDPKFEVGTQFSTIDLSIGRATTFTSFPCLVPPCPGIENSSSQRTMEPGFGGRFGFNFNHYFAVEAETNIFPRDREFDGGRKLQLVAGVKAGKRFDKLGVFAKARPGFVRLSRGDYRFGSGGCPTVFPPPIGCYVPVVKTSFAFDAGGVVEVYPSSRTIIRFDAGDTIIRYGPRIVPVVIDPGGGSTSFARVVAVTAPAQTVHNLQLNVGFGFRF